MALDPSGAGTAVCPATLDAEHTRAENAHVAKFGKIRERDVQRLNSAHRETRDRSVPPLVRHSIALFDERPDVLPKLGDKVVDLLVQATSLAKRKWSRVAHRHDDDHRLGFVRGN